MKNDFNMCPMCASKKIECRENKKWVCPDCGFDLYCNVASAVGALIYDDEKNVLFEVRAKDPAKGRLAIPGGFVNFDERAEEAVIRECREEIGVEVQNPQFLCTYPNTYLYKNIEYKTCDIFFTVKLKGSMSDFIKKLSAEKSEVVSFECHKVTSASDIEKLPLAFESTVNTLKKWIGVEG